MQLSWRDKRNAESKTMRFFQFQPIHHFLFQIFGIFISKQNIIRQIKFQYLIVYQIQKQKMQDIVHVLWRCRIS